MTASTIKVMRTAVVLFAIGRLALANPAPTPVAFENDLIARATKSCNADNCARLVTGTRTAIPAATRLADCSSYLQTTYSYAFYTSLETIVPTDVPTYAASACAGGSVDRYSSACACLGVKPSSTTILPYDCTPEIEQQVDDCGCPYAGECYTSFKGDSFYDDGLYLSSECLSACSSVPECVAAVYLQLEGFCTLYSKVDRKQTDLVFDKYAVGLVRQNASCTCTSFLQDDD